jgi:hypothetical protein
MGFSRGELDLSCKKRQRRTDALDPGEQGKGAVAALLGGIEERLENLNRSAATSYWRCSNGL